MSSSSIKYPYVKIKIKWILHLFKNGYENCPKCRRKKRKIIKAQLDLQKLLNEPVLILLDIETITNLLDDMYYTRLDIRKEISGSENLELIKNYYFVVDVTNDEVVKTIELFGKDKRNTYGKNEKFALRDDILIIKTKFRLKINPERVPASTNAGDTFSYIITTTHIENRSPIIMEWPLDTSNLNRTITHTSPIFEKLICGTQTNWIVSLPALSLPESLTFGLELLNLKNIDIRARVTFMVCNMQKTEIDIASRDIMHYESKILVQFDVPDHFGHGPKVLVVDMRPIQITNTVMKHRPYTLPPGILRGYGEMFNSTECSDVVIHVNGVYKFPAHKIILSTQSDVFRGMLRSGMQEETSGIINITDLSEGTVYNMLKFLYTGIMSPNHYVPDLAVAADKYLIPGLKAVCETRIIKQLTKNNASKWLEVSNFYNLTRVREYILRRFNAANGGGGID